MAIDNRSNLFLAIESTLKRDFASSEMDTFISQATAQIGIDLRSPANEGFVVLAAQPDPRTNIYLLPTDYAEPRFVEQVNGSYLQQIRPQGVAVQNQFETLGNTAARYLIYSDTETGTQAGQMVLQLLPGNGQDINLSYWQIPSNISDSGAGGAQTNPVLLQYPNLYLNAALGWAWEFVQGWTQSDRSRQLYQAELTRINMASNTARYGAGAARSAPARFYNSAPSRAM